MSKLQNYLVEEHQGARLVEGDKNKTKSKSDYIANAKPGLIIAFRFFFEAKSKVKLTKVISGKIIENDKEAKQYTVETKNELKFFVPYAAVVWLKNGSRWPKGVYDEMKQGAVEVDVEMQSDFGGLESTLDVDSE